MKNAYIIPLREQAKVRNSWLEERFRTVLAEIMDREGFDMWIISGREYNEDPVMMSMFPQPMMSARRRTILVFYREKSEEGHQDASFSEDAVPSESCDSLERITIARGVGGRSSRKAEEKLAGADRWVLGPLGGPDPQDRRGRLECPGAVQPPAHRQQRCETRSGIDSSPTLFSLPRKSPPGAAGHPLPGRFPHPLQPGAHFPEPLDNQQYPSLAAVPFGSTRNFSETRGGFRPPDDRLLQWAASRRLGPGSPSFSGGPSRADAGGAGNSRSGKAD